MRKQQSGFTLIEVLISATILVVAAAAVAVIISRGSKINKEDMLSRRAYQVMEEVLERPDLSHRNYLNLLDNIGADNTVLEEDLGSIKLFEVGSQQINATLERRLEKVMYNYNGVNIPGIKVTVRVTQGNKTDSLSSIITNR